MRSGGSALKNNSRYKITITDTRIQYCITYIVVLLRIFIRPNNSDILRVEPMCLPDNCNHFTLEPSPATTRLPPSDNLFVFPLTPTLDRDQWWRESQGRYYCQLHGLNAPQNNAALFCPLHWFVFCLSSVKEYIKPSILGWWILVAMTTISATNITSEQAAMRWSEIIIVFSS